MQVLHLVLGVCLVCWGVTCLTAGLLYLDRCPRHPLLSLWLLVMGVIILLGSVCVLALPTCAPHNTSKMTNHKVSVCTVILVFLTMLLTVLLVLTIVSWLSIGTFWLFNSSPRVSQEYDKDCSTVLLVLVGITVVGSWVGLVGGLVVGAWQASKTCDWSRASYFPVRRRERGTEYLRVESGGHGGSRQ